MNIRSRKALGLTFSLIFVFSIYVALVQTVNLSFARIKLIKSFVVTDSAESVPLGQFHVGDTMVVMAESELPGTYTLEIFENASLILTVKGESSAEIVEIEIPLDPPVFNAGKSYVATFTVYVCDNPILGAYLTDSVASGFGVVSADTKLELATEYDGLFHGLYLNANLTRVDGHPIANEKVDFRLQFDSGRPTEGWIPLGSTRTSIDGSAELNLAFGLPDKSYRIKALHEGDVNYGASNTVKGLEVLSDATIDASKFAAEESLSSESISVFSGSSVGNLTLEVSSTTPYAFLPMNATARYVSDTPLPGPYTAIFFYWDFTLFAEAGFFTLEEGGPPYSYWTPYVFSTNFWGVRTLIAGIASGTIDELIEAQDYGTGLIATDEVVLDIQPCPARIVLDYPEVAYSDSNVLPITAAVSAPRPYEIQNDDFVVQATLAPRLSYNGVEYVYDGASTVLVNFYVNDTRKASKLTNEYGFVGYELDLNSTSSRVKVEIDDYCSWFSAEPVEEILSPTKIRICDRSSAADDPVTHAESYLDEGSRYPGMDAGSVHYSVDGTANILATYGGGATDAEYSFKKSNTNGLSWDSRVVIDSDIVGSYHGNTLNFYDSASGRIGVVFKDGGDDLAAKYSEDGGLTWSAKNVGKKGTVVFFCGILVGNKILVEFCDYSANYYLYQTSYNIATNTWSKSNQITQITDFGNIYNARVFKDINGRVHLAFSRFDTGLVKYRDIYYMYSDDQGSTWRSKNGSLLALPIGVSSQARVYTGTDSVVSSITADGVHGKIYIVNGLEAGKIYFWNGSAWSMKTAHISIGGKSGDLQALIWYKGALCAVFIIWDGFNQATKDLVYGYSVDDGNTWNRLTKFTWDNIDDGYLIMNNAIYNGMWYGSYVHGWTDSYGQDLCFVSLLVPGIVDLSRFSFTVTDEPGDEELYVGAESPLEVQVSLLNQSVWNLPVSITYCKFVSSAQTDPYGVAYIPASADYVRLPNTTMLWGDVNGDMAVDLFDALAVQYSYWSYPGHQRWNADADLNHDNIVDQSDYAMVRYNYGKAGNHLVFSTGQTVYLDSEGFAAIPVGATSLTVYLDGVQVVNASVDFFKIASEKTSRTNNLGRIAETWAPPEIGRYLVQVKLSSKFDVLSFTQSNMTGIAGLDARVNLVSGYFEVVKRPIDLSVSYEPTQPKVDDWVTMIANVFDTGLGEPAEGLSVEFYVSDKQGGFIPMGSSNTNSSGLATLAWLPRNYTDLYGLTADFSLLSRIAETASTTEVESFPISVDARYPTRLVFFMDGDVRNVDVGKDYTLPVKLMRADDGSPVVGKRIDLYCNDVKVNSSFTDANGIVSFEMYANEAGIYYYRAVFDVWDQIYRPSFLSYPNALTAGRDQSRASLDGQIRHSYGGAGEIYEVDSTSTTARVGWIIPHRSATEWNMYFSFNTSRVPDNATVISANLKLKVADDFWLYDADIDVYGGTQPIYGSMLDTYDWNCGTAFQSTRSISEVVVGQYMDWAIQPSQINKFGETQFEVRHNGASGSWVDFYTAEQGMDDAPLLDVIYGYVPNEEARLVVIAEVVPTVTYFDVRPRDFKPSTQITLNATVRNAASGQSIGEGRVVNFYKVDQNGAKTILGQNQTDPRGVALYSYVYPEGSGPYAFIAEPTIADSPNVISSSGITLTVAQPAAITLSIERDQSTYNHMISGNLRSEGVGIVGKQIKILVNDAVKAILTTTTDGQFSIQLHLEPLNSNPTTYRIMASFEGDNANAVTATASAATPNGTQYAVCTTTQYDYKSTHSCFTLTVEPPKTEVTAPAGNEPPTQSPEGTTVILPPTKTPEQMQQEANQTGWLTTWNEFSWWYPWYRLHLVLNASLPQGRLHLDYGWTLLPFGQTLFTQTPEVVAAVFNDLAANIAWKIAEAYLVGKLIQHVAALLLAKTLVGVAIAIAAYVSFSIIETIDLYLNSGNDPIAWLAAFVVSAISGTFGLFEAGLRELVGFLTAVGRQILGKITYIMNSFWARGLDFFDITGIAFSLIDFTFMVFYLAQYVNMVA